MTLRHALLGLSACAALGLASPALALYGGIPLVGAQVPDWVVGNAKCAGTLISPRVILTSALCIQMAGNDGFYLRRTGTSFWGKTATYPSDAWPLGDVGLVMTDTFLDRSSYVQTAPLASYAEERQALRDADNRLPLVVFANDSDSGNFATAARTADAWGNWSRDTFRDADKMVYRSATYYRHTTPSRLTWALSGTLFNAAMRDYIYTTLKFTDKDVDDSLVFTAPPVDGPSQLSPIHGIDAGGGIFYRQPDGMVRLLAPISYSKASPRISSLWPWIVKTLVAKGMRDDAYFLSNKVLGTSGWGSKRGIGQVGQIFAYNNPYSRRLEYLRLASVAPDGRYGAFPINQRDNENWEYLGTELPDIEQATTPIKAWGSNDRRAAVGDIFVYNNPNTRSVEYFRLTGLGGDGRYWYFPVNRKNNEYWTYLGTDLPTRPIKYALVR